MFTSKYTKRNRRQMHIRKTVSGSDDKPRVFVFKSNKYLHTGVSDDNKGVVLLGGRGKRTMEGAQTLGKEVAKKLKGKKLETAVFDRSGYKFHGIILKFVESLRENGIKI
ncbi:MAG TPA: 50S ribosomal protein L18 [Candidatus Dojkabacteria bacterium]|nr:50S ribosomal protein L18 [Candidatus Dojkabacteria bacterium]